MGIVWTTIKELAKAKKIQKKQAKLNSKSDKQASRSISRTSSINYATGDKVEQTSDYHEKEYPSKRRRISSKEEKNILAPLLKSTTMPSEIMIAPYLEMLSKDWDIKRVKAYWNNNNENKKNK